MENIIIPFIIGVICIIIGISNMKGNISTLHSYHRKRVSEEDRIPFGKKVGLGMIICGGGIIVNGIFSAVSTFTEKQIYLTIGMVIMIICLAMGLAISFWAMMKYNKGIF
ncbi:MAG: hypothetical protein IJ944_01270 [Clostridia bacterium]|nr:hypothetical protein [Clostridia bacterium]